MQYLADINTPNLSEEKQKQCEGKLTLKEIWDSLVSMKNGKVLETMDSQRNSILHFFLGTW